MARRCIALLVAAGIVGGLLVWFARPGPRELTPAPGARSDLSPASNRDLSDGVAKGPDRGRRSDEVEAFSLDGNEDVMIAAQSGRVAVRVIHTDEESMIANTVCRVLGLG